MKRVFLLSPANCNGVRAGWILRRNARSEMAKRLRHPEGVPLAEVYTFLSALYFRGKIAYARAFANPPPSAAGDGAVRDGSVRAEPSAPSADPSRAANSSRQASSTDSGSSR